MHRRLASRFARPVAAVEKSSGAAWTRPSRWLLTLSRWALRWIVLLVLTLLIPEREVEEDPGEVHLAGDYPVPPLDLRVPRPKRRPVPAGLGGPRPPAAAMTTAGRPASVGAGTDAGKEGPDGTA